MRTGLRRAVDVLAATRLKFHTTDGPTVVPQVAEWETSNVLGAASVIAEAALMREESRGGHQRTDFPDTSDAWRVRLAGDARPGRGTAADEGADRTELATGPAPRTGPCPTDAPTLRRSEPILREHAERIANLSHLARVSRTKTVRSVGLRGVGARHRREDL